MVSISGPISVYMKGVRCVSIRGNPIVSGSDDGMLYCWNATTGESIGSGKFVACYLRSAYTNLF